MRPASTNARRAAPKGVARLSQLTGQPARAIDPQFGTEGPRAMAVIDEAWCIGCTLCLDACPTDAILGIHKRMHTVIEAHCTGCELCIPVCPVDCISLEVATPGKSGWQAWSQAQADAARSRYEAHRRRHDKDEPARGRAARGRRARPQTRYRRSGAGARACCRRVTQRSQGTPMTLDTLLLFMIASVALAITPGPTMLLAMSNGIAGGMRAAVWGIAGASLGAAILIAVVALGLGSLLAASEGLFNAIRVAGVAYLVWLGVKMWRSQPIDIHAALAASPADVLRGRTAFLRSLTVALSNPKTLLFFAAFLPQFVTTTSPQIQQYVVLGTIFIGIDTCVMLGYAAAGTQAVRWLSRRSLRMVNRGCAAGMWLLAATLAVWRRPGA